MLGNNPPYGTQGGNGGRQGQKLAEDFYVYSAQFGNMAAAATALQNLQVQADSDFEWIMSTCYGNLHGGTEPFSDAILLPINIQILDSGSGRNLFSAALPISCIAGSGKQPFILPVSRLFMSRSNISVSATNFDASNQYDNIVLNFIGRKIFKLSA